MRCARIIQNCMLSCETIFTRIRWNFLQRVWARNGDRHHERSAAKPKIPWRCREVMLRDGTPGLAPKAFGDALQPRLSLGMTANLLRLRDDSKIWLGRFPALRITLLCLFVRHRAGDDNVFSGQPVDRRSHLVLRSQL